MLNCPLVIEYYKVGCGIPLLWYYSMVSRVPSKVQRLQNLFGKIHSQFFFDCEEQVFCIFQDFNKLYVFFKTRANCAQN